ncbi:Transposase DDE domain-containing protein [Methylobacterium sp. 174MFSha1.1]|nr:Transposase DDE domain-containing protein [Methylobacterium sp. 174MFSha1.1]
MRQRLHQVLLERLRAAGEIDWSRAIVDGASVPAKNGSLPLARTRRTGARRGPKRHLATDARGTPLGLVLTGANCHDSPLMAPTLDAPVCAQRAA